MLCDIDVAHELKTKQSWVMYCNMTQESHFNTYNLKVNCFGDVAHELEQRKGSVMFCDMTRKSHFGSGSMIWPNMTQYDP